MNKNDINLLNEAYVNINEDEESKKKYEYQGNPEGPGIYEIYHFADVNWGTGHGGTIVYIKHAENTDDAIAQFDKWRGKTWKWDPDGISWGVEKIDQLPKPPTVI